MKEDRRSDPLDGVINSSQKLHVNNVFPTNIHHTLVGSDQVRPPLNNMLDIHLGLRKCFSPGGFPGFEQ